MGGFPVNLDFVVTSSSTCTCTVILVPRSTRDTSFGSSTVNLMWGSWLLMWLPPIGKFLNMIRVQHCKSVLNDTVNIITHLKHTDGQLGLIASTSNSSIYKLATSGDTGGEATAAPCFCWWNP